MFYWEFSPCLIYGHRGHRDRFSSPFTFFTILALVIYDVLLGIFGLSDNQYQQRAIEVEELQPPPPPVQLGEVSEKDLKQYDGSDPKKPLLVAIKGQIYDVSKSRMFYRPGGRYALFTGKDASRALAKMSFEDKDLTGDVSDLGPYELEALQDWEYQFMSKYVKVGTIKKTVSVIDGPASGESAETREADVAKPVEDSPSETPALGVEETPSGNDAKTE